MTEIKNDITAAIVVRNEEKRIKKCLNSLKGAVNEIILIHDGKCDDDTIKIAKKFGAKTFIRKYIGEAEPHRKFSFEKASNNWILQIDADEFLTEKLRKEMTRLVKNNDISGYAFKWNVAMINQPKRYSTKLALFQKNKITKFEGIPHETVTLNGKILILNNLELGHDRNQMSKKELKHKLTVWPKVQGEYMARYKYKNIWLILLIPGYVYYPIGAVIIRIIKGEDKTIKDMFHVFIYSFRSWDALVRYRFKMLFNKKII